MERGGRILIVAALALLLSPSAAHAKQPIVALTTSNSLLTFDANAPGTILSTVAVSGLQSGENLLGIDLRPVDHQLYGLGSTGRLYRVDRVSGAATQIGTGTFAVALNGIDFGFDVNPTVDRIRITSDAEQNMRVNPNNGTVVDGDPATPGTQADGNLNPPGNVVASAYTNDFTGAVTTSLYGIDSALDSLVLQNPPNNGVLTQVGLLGVDTLGLVGFDIAPLSGTAYASLTVGAGPQLFTVNLTTGAATLIGTIGNGSQAIRGIAAIGSSPTVYAATDATLLRFNASLPTSTTTTPITGMQAGETVRGLDARPATGALYALGSTSRVYRVDPATGVATQVGGAFSPALNGASFGFDFNPVTDRIRLVSDAEQNLRLDPDTGAVSVVDAALNPPGSVVASGYTDSFLGATATTLFGIDSGSDKLVRQGGLDGSPSPNGGVLTDVNPLGVDTDSNANLDLTPFEVVALATLRVGAVTQLYVVNTTTGVATAVGAVDTGAAIIRGLTVASSGRLEPGPDVAVGESSGVTTITVTRSGGSDGPTAIRYQAVGGSATGGSDFEAVSGTLLFAPAELSKTFDVPILADATFEGNETVNVTLTGGPAVGGAAGPRTTAVVTIVDDDPAPPVVPVVPAGAAPIQVLNAAPVLSAASVSNRVFAPVAARSSARRRAPRGTRFRFTLSEDARVAIGIDRTLPGRRVGRACRAPTRALRRRPACKRYVRRGALSSAGKLGRNTVRFSGRLRGRGLPAGRYRARLVAIDAGGLRSATRTVAFRVVAR